MLLCVRLHAFTLCAYLTSCPAFVFCAGKEEEWTLCNAHVQVRTLARVKTFEIFSTLEDGSANSEVHTVRLAHECGEIEMLHGMMHGE